MSGMEAQMHDIARSASQALLDPFLLTVPVVGVLAFVTGFAGRIALFVEDFMYDRTLARRDPHPFEAALMRNGTSSRRDRSHPPIKERKKMETPRDLKEARDGGVSRQVVRSRGEER